MKTILVKDRETDSVLLTLSTYDGFSFGDLLRLYQLESTNPNRVVMLFDLEKEELIPIQKLEEYIAVLEAVRITKEMMGYNW